MTGDIKPVRQHSMNEAQHLIRIATERASLRVSRRSRGRSKASLSCTVTSISALLAYNEHAETSQQPFNAFKRRELGSPSRADRDRRDGGARGARTNAYWNRLRSAATSATPRRSAGAVSLPHSRAL